MLVKTFNCGPIEMDTKLEWLIRDGLVDIEYLVETRGPVYRITHRGFMFIREVENSNSATSYARWALAISMAAVLISIVIPIGIEWFKWARETNPQTKTTESGILPKTKESGKKYVPMDTVQQKIEKDTTPTKR